MVASALKPVCAAIVVTAIALISIWSGEPILAPSLAAAAFTQILTPDTPGARPYPIGVGQFCGLAGGFAGVFVADAAAAPMFIAGHPLVYARALAVLIAIPVAIVLELLLKAMSPAGGATAIIVALGLDTANWTGFGRMAVGIVLVTILGEGARRIILLVRD